MNKKPKVSEVNLNSSMDLHFIGGEFSKNILPPEYRFLIKYYKSDLTRAFIYYYFQFGELRSNSTHHFFHNFVDHTGMYCTIQRLWELTIKTDNMIALLKQAQEDFNLDLVERIKSGKFRPSELNKKKDT